MLYDCKGLSSALLEYANYKPMKDKTKKTTMSEEDRIKFEHVINRILEFNESYELQKAEKSKLKKKIFKRDH